MWQREFQSKAEGHSVNGGRNIDNRSDYTMPQDEDSPDNGRRTNQRNRNQNMSYSQKKMSRGQSTPHSSSFRRDFNERNMSGNHGKSQRGFTKQSRLVGQEKHPSNSYLRDVGPSDWSNENMTSPMESYSNNVGLSSMHNDFHQSYYQNSAPPNMPKHNKEKNIVPQSSMSQQSSGHSSQQNIGPPFISQFDLRPPHQNIRHPNASSQNIRLDNMSPQNMGPSNMSQRNMGPSNMSPQNMGPSNMSQRNIAQQNNMPQIYPNGPTFRPPPPPYGYMPPDRSIPPPGQFMTIPPPDSMIIGGNMPPPCSIPPPIPPERSPVDVPIFSPNIEQEFTQGSHCQSSKNKDRILDQTWVNHFVEERKLNVSEKKETRKLKVGEAKKALQNWSKSLKEVERQHNKLTDCIKSGDSEWQRELQKTNILKDELDQAEGAFSSNFDIKSLQNEIKRKQKKRKWQKRRRKFLATRKKESQEKTFELHHQIDQWREKEIAKIQAKFKDASIKKEAGGVLGDVRRKQGDASKAINLLQGIKKLRSFRKQEAEIKGVYQKPTQEQTEEFEQRLEKLEKIMEKHHKVYECEERALSVMIAEEEEEKERERREKKLYKKLVQASATDSTDPMREFYRYYTQAENGLDSLLHIRHGWDMYIVPETVSGGSCIPHGDITATQPTYKTWASLLQATDNE